MLPLAYPIILDVERPRIGSLADLHNYLRQGTNLELYLAYPQNLDMNPFRSALDILEEGTIELMTRGVDKEELLGYILAEWHDASDMLLGLVRELRWRRRWP